MTNELLVIEEREVLGIRRAKDLTGKRFGRLVAIKKLNSPFWLCKCDCGKERIVASNHLGRTTNSCGCIKRELGIKQLEKHGLTTGGKPRIFGVWCGMRQRCYDKNTKAYSAYGARGIVVCDEWLSFKAFHKWALLNGYKENLTIDRIDNNGNYEPSNCRWITRIENAKNQRSCIYLTIDSTTDSISGWVKRLNICKPTLYRKFRKDREAMFLFIKNQYSVSNGGVY